MPSSTIRCLLLSIFSLVLLAGASQTASACSCGTRPTVLDAFEKADEVIIARPISVEKVRESEKATHENEQPNVYGAGSATLIVEKIFKGTLKVRDEIVFGPGNGANCIWTFTQDSIGDQFLLYLKRPEQDLWYAYSCGRSRELEGASDDLLYLENMNKLRGKTRISGRLGGWQNPNLDAEGKTITIIGPTKTYETKTNHDGVFEIYDLPPGRYSIQPEMAPGWKIDAYSLRYSASVVPGDFLRPKLKSLKQVQITLHPKKHASIDIGFEADNRVRGRVFGPKGKPLQGSCVYLLRPGQDSWGPSDCTTEEGRFEITAVPQGEYVLVANQYGKPSHDHPFPKIFYPSVPERERATTIYVNPGDVIENIDIIVPKLEETITIDGVLRFSDGRPAHGMQVMFTAIDPNNNVDGDVREQTDKAGRFTMKVLKGLTGELAGQELLIRGVYEDCNDNFDELLAKTAKNNIYVRSNVIKLATDQNRYNLELTFPFARCDVKK